MMLTELYKAKENVLLKELDAAKSAAEVATVASEALQARISEAEVQLHRTLTELEVSHQVVCYPAQTCRTFRPVAGAPIWLQTCVNECLSSWSN
jgi:hypothetical protein